MVCKQALGDGTSREEQNSNGSKTAREERQNKKYHEPACNAEGVSLFSGDAFMIPSMKFSTRVFVSMREASLASAGRKTKKERKRKESQARGHFDRTRAAKWRREEVRQLDDVFCFPTRETVSHLFFKCAEEAGDVSFWGGGLGRLTETCLV